MRIVWLIFLLLVPAPALAWGPEGHEVVAHVAARELTPHARAAVARLLGGDAETMMVLDASWADEVRDDRPETASWHYVNVELEEPFYDARRDCPESNCVVAQIARDEAALARRPDAETLKFLIHFIADIHQPLHVGDHGDRGGNARQLFYRGRRVNLHHLWDDDVVAALGRDPAEVANSISRALTPQMKQSLSGGTPQDWANQSLGVARGIYGGLAGDDVPDDYARRQAAITRLQLARAGLRLAAALNAAFR